MRMFLLPLLAGLMVSSVGCGPRTAMTESEFKGFCYQTGGHRGGDCDNIALCDTYTTVVGVAQPSLEKCLRGCIDVHRQNTAQYLSAQCINVSQAGMDYCQRYCRTVFDK